jgi:hypothetical protein
MFRREVGRIALTEYGEGACLVMGSVRATVHQKLVVEAPTFVAAAAATNAEAEVPVAEIAAVVDYLARAVMRIEGVPNVTWDGLTEEQRVEFVDGLGVVRIAMLYQYYSVLKLHASGVQRFGDDVIGLIATGREPEPVESSSEEE